MHQNKNTVLVLGGDGYFGWSLGLALAKRTDISVILVDNLVKRRLEKENGSKPLIPFAKPEKRISEYNRIFGKSNLSFEKLDILNYKGVTEIIKKYHPFAIVNAAQQPSAPFSMASPKNAAYTYRNNIIGHLNLLWAIAEIDKNISYIKLGSAGCYHGIETNCIPLDKVNLNFIRENKQYKIFKSWLPMYANDFYHQSKITDFLISELAVNVWKVKTATVQQSIIFGVRLHKIT